MCHIPYVHWSPFTNLDLTLIPAWISNLQTILSVPRKYLPIPKIQRGLGGRGWGGEAYQYEEAPLAV